MAGTPLRRLRALGRSPFALALVLAVLASACLPVLANADSLTDQYTEPLPESTGSNSSHSNEAVVGGGTSASGGGGGSGSQASSSSNGTAETSASGGTSGGTAQSTPGQSTGTNGKAQDAEANIGDSATVEPSGSQDGSAKQVSSESGGGSSSGGSSPLLPILIAVAVLAAISIAVVSVRAKRRSGTSVGPYGREMG